MQMLSTTDEVIDALGGNAKVGALLGVSGDAVSTYREWYRGKFPARTYVILQKALAEAEKSAPGSLWGMTGPDPRPAQLERAGT